MRPESRLDCAVFQLTPTRTRCDLVLEANGRKEKIASGLLNPFLAHLKSAQDQIAKGGYSIKLEPDPDADAAWFTKGTLERFVRFVSTPEILERVTTIESEILQIEDAIAIQSNDNIGLRTGDDLQSKRAEGADAIRTTYEGDADKAIVIYKPGSQPQAAAAANETAPEENSKVQLLRVLETRKAVLRKEQAMAFARATAAGFDMDSMLFLISFANCFGASRLMKACSQFMDLWKRKHETGQWIEVEPEAMSMRSEFPPYNSSGIVFVGENAGQNGDTMSISNGDANADANPKIAQQPGAYPPWVQGAYPPWAMHPPPGAAMYHSYPMPYYPNYQSPGPYYHPSYPPPDDSRYHGSERKPRRRRSMDDSKDNEDSETWEDGTDNSASEQDKDDTRSRRSHRRNDRSGKKQPVVVIRNLNLVSSNKHGSAESEESEPASGDETEEYTDKSHSKSNGKKHRDSSGSSKKRDDRKDDRYEGDDMTYGQEADQGNWQAFQSLLLKAEEKSRTNDGDLFSGEKEPLAKRRESRAAADLTVLPDRDSGSLDDRFSAGFDSNSGRARVKPVMSADAMLMSGEGRGFGESDLKEIEGGCGVYRGGSGDDFIVRGQDNTNSRRYLDPLAGNEFERTPNVEKKVYTVTDDSFMIPVRSGSDNHHAPDDRTAIDIDIEIPSTVQREPEPSTRLSDQPSYEPNALAMMPERGLEVSSFSYESYDPALDYESQIVAESNRQKEPAVPEDVPAETAEEPKETAKDKKPKNAQSGLNKRNKDAFVRRLSTPRTGPLNEAQKRADALRSYKADLQKLKKEQEDEQIKRLERLKEERQKRIAARSGTQAPASPQPAKPKPVAKASPSSLVSSKFSDAEPSSSSPIKKLASRTTSVGSDPSKATKTTSSRLNGPAANGLSKSVSSLPEAKKENGESASGSSRTKVPDAKGSGSATSSKPKAAISVNARRELVAEEAETKKISAIVQLDQSKTAALPELKVKFEKSPVSQGNKDGLTELANMNNGCDDNVVVVEKTVVIENEVVSAAPAALVTAAATTKEKASMPLGLPTSSPVIVKEVKTAAIPTADDQMNSFEVVIDHVGDNASEKPYQAPVARVTSMDSTIKIPSYIENPQDFEPEVHVEHKSIRAPLSEPVEVVSEEDHIHEVSEKSRSKELKGFRKLWKFGRKGHTSSSVDGSMDSDASSVDESTISGIPSDDAPKSTLAPGDAHQAGSTSQKDSSRHFSILSPFRSKNSDKKVSA